MSVPRTIVIRTTLAVAALGLFLAPSSASAQSQLDTSQATEFLGNWSIPFESPQGATTLQVTVRDQAGKVAASITIPEVGDAINITNITRSDTGLAMRYAIDFQGTPLNAAITLRPAASGYVAVLDFADGAFTAEAPATKRP